MRSRLPVHRHPNGHWCHCPFGLKDPYTPPEEREVYGHKESTWHEASKLDWLRERGDKDPTFDRFLDRLELAYPDHDSLYPWLARERKKGRINDPMQFALNKRWPQAHRNFGEGSYTTPLHFTDHQGYVGALHPETLDQINDWIAYQKQVGKGKGIDIMQHHIGDVAHEARKFDIGGEVVHELPDGYKVLKLRNQRDMTKEGDRMNHCIGGFDYSKENDAGDSLFYSLRDKDNEPWGTVEINKEEDEYYKCPHCKKFGFGEYKYNPETRRTDHLCENCGGTLHGEGVPAEGLETHPLTLKGKTHPDSKYTRINALFGRNDFKMHPHHEEMFNQYFAQHGHDYYESDGDPEEEEEEFEPWWDNYYSAYGPRTVQDYLDHHDDPHSYYEGNTSDEYQRAVRDAHEHELEPPNVEVDSPDWDDIWDDAMNHADPEDFNKLWEAAAENSEHEQLAERAHNWIDEHFSPYLDPYGQHDGPGHFVQRGVTPPMTNKMQHGLPAVNEPGGHFPDTHDEQEDKHNYLNIMYQLDKHFPVDPQTGKRMDQDQRNQKYPLDAPSQRTYNPGPNSPIPEYGKPQIPVTEQTGPTQTPRLPVDADQYITPGRRNVELPYGRGENVPFDERENRGRGQNGGPNQPGYQPNLFSPTGEQPSVFSPGGDNPRTRPRDRGEYYHDQPQEEVPETRGFLPTGPGTPEELFGPGNETTRMHQRSFPGMQWRDLGIQRGYDNWEEDTSETPYAKPREPYNPTEPQMFGQGQQQGNLFPSGYYIDYAKQRAMKTELPEYLFQSDRFGYHDPGYRDQGYSGTHPGQTTPMWEQSDHPNWSVINTQNELPSQQNPMPYPVGPNQYYAPVPPQHIRPAGPFIASTKESGEWTEVEEKGGKPRPKSDKTEGYGSFDIPVQHGKPHLNGRIIESVLSPDQYTNMPGFEWRRPVVYDRTEDRLYVGQPAMEHAELMKNFHKPNPWGAMHAGTKLYKPGYIDTGDYIGGGLGFFGDDDIPDSEALHDWVEAKYGVRNPNRPDPEVSWGNSSDEMEHESTYHPTQQDEWAADDEPVFSAVIPEARWAS